MSRSVSPTGQQQLQGEQEEEEEDQEQEPSMELREVCNYKIYRLYVVTYSTVTLC